MSELLFDKEARDKLKIGICKLADAVKVTLGPSGRNVVIKDYDGSIKITKDGVTVANSIVLNDEFEDIGAQLLKDVALKTLKDAGDGTTTSTILAQSIILNGLEYIESGANPLELKNGIDEAVKAVVKSLKESSKQISDDDIKNVATISANGDEEIGDLIDKAIKTVGYNGIITVERSPNSETYIRTSDGFKINSGFISPHFITDESKSICELESPLIFVYNKKINNLKDIASVLQSISQANQSLLIICDDIEMEALNGLIVNKIRKGFKVCAIKSPGFGIGREDYIEDINCLINGFIDTNLKLPRVQKVTVSNNETIIVGAVSEESKLKTRVESINNKIDLEENEFNKSKLKERLAQLDGGVCTLYVGANSELEYGEKYDRIDDAIRATRSAIEEGVSIGGGFSMYFTKYIVSKFENSESFINGINVINNSLESITNQLIINSCLDKSIKDKFCFVLDEKTNKYKTTLYNFKTNKFEDIKKSGIIDPTKVLRVALENAASIAGLFLTTQCVILNKQ